MPEIVLSICGGSAVGKLSLIEKLLGGDRQLCERFGIAGMSMAAFGPMCGPPIRQHNRGWHTLLQQATQQVVLYQWQKCYHSVIKENIERFPNARHRAIVIWRPPLEHWQDFCSKHAVKLKEEQDLDWLKDQSRHYWTTLLKPLPIEVELVNGATPDYVKLDDWPE